MFNLNKIPPVYARISNPAISGFLGTGAGTGMLAFLISTIWTTLITLAGIATLLFMVWGGLEWLTAGGDKARVEAARHRITNAVFGMAIVAGSLAISLFLETVFKIDLVNPTFWGLPPSVFGTPPSVP